MASRSCSSCNKDLQKVEYSANQWKKGPSAKCKSCISGGGSSSVAAAATITKDTHQKQKIDSFDTKTKTPQTEKDGKVEVDVFYSSKSFIPTDESGVPDGDKSPTSEEVEDTKQDDFHDAKDDNEEEEEDNKRLTLERNRALSSLGRTLSASAKKNNDDTLKELAADVRDSKIPEADTNYPSSPTKSISSYIGDDNDDAEADKSTFIGDINDTETDELLPPVVPDIEEVEENENIGKKEDDTKPETENEEEGLDTVQANQDKAKGDDWVVVDDVDLERYRQPMRGSSGENTAGESEFETLVNTSEKKEEKKSPWTLAQRLAKKLIVRTCCLKSVRDSNVSEEV